jgi:hypothetical protein
MSLKEMRDSIQGWDLRDWRMEKRQLFQSEFLSVGFIALSCVIALQLIPLKLTYGMHSALRIVPTVLEVMFVKV